VHRSGFLLDRALGGVEQFDRWVQGRSVALRPSGELEHLDDARFAAFTTTKFDVFLADKAWFYVTLLAVGYMISRGLAKSGVRAHRDA